MTKSYSQRKLLSIPSSSNHPFKVFASFDSEDEEGEFSVSLTKGFLFKDQSDALITISNIGSVIKSSPPSGDKLWIVLELDIEENNWPVISEAKISLIKPEDMSGTFKRFRLASDTDPLLPPIQDKSYTLIATININSGSISSIDQFVTSNLRMVNFMDSSVVVTQPVSL